ncbi:MAG: hypothetical protein ACLTDV_02610 [Eubacterium sp.]
MKHSTEALILIVIPNETDGMLSFRITEKNGTDAQLLLESLILGFREHRRSNYEEYIDLIFEEV